MAGDRIDLTDLLPAGWTGPPPAAGPLPPPPSPEPRHYPVLVIVFCLLFSLPWWVGVYTIVTWVL